MTRSDIRFPFTTGSPIRLSHLCFSLLFCLLLRLFHQAFVGCSLVFILISVSGVFSLIFSVYTWLHSALCWWVSFAPPFICFFFPFVRPCWIVGGFCLAILPYSSVGSLSFPSFVRGFSVLGISLLVPESLHSWSLGVSFFWSWLWPFPLCSSSPLCVLTALLVRPWAFPSLHSSWFVSPRSSSSLFLSAFCFLSFFLGHFLQFLVLLFFGWGSLFPHICRSFVPFLHLPRLLYLASFTFIPSAIVGVHPVVLHLCLFQLFGVPCHVLWLSLSAVTLFLSILLLLSILFSDLFHFLFSSGCCLSCFQGF